MTNGEKLVLLLLMTVVAGYAQWELSPAAAPQEKQVAVFVPTKVATKTTKKKSKPVEVAKPPDAPPVKVVKKVAVEIPPVVVKIPDGEKLAALQKWDPLPLTIPSEVTRPYTIYKTVRNLKGVTIDESMYDKRGNLNHDTEEYKLLRQQLKDVIDNYDDIDLDLIWELFETEQVKLEFRDYAREKLPYGGWFGIRVSDDNKYYVPFIALEINTVINAEANFGSLAEALYHEHQHYLYFQRHVSFPGYINYMLGRDTTLSMDSRCVLSWETEYEANFATAYKMRSWGYKTNQTEAIHDVSVFRQRFFFRVTNHPEEDSYRICYAVWAVLAGHPHPESFVLDEPSKK